MTDAAPHPAVRFARNVGILLVGAMALTYLIALGALVLWQRDMLFVGARYAAVEAPERSIYRTRTIKERDATLTVWQADAGKGRPTIVFFYGNGGTLLQFVEMGEALNAQGYGIVLASYRGYGGNPGSPSEAGLMDDARAILSPLPSDRTILWGQSLGTGVAARMAAEGRGAALILQSPYTAIVDVAARDFWVFPVRIFMWDRFDTLALVPKIKVPVLIVAGTADQVVPYDMGVTLSQRFGRQSEFVTVPGGGHMLPDDAMLPAVEAFLKRRGE
ncbi:MAG: alpha/beta hydrolase [Alphaproteobacteria bacterium]|nr:alpha/beta hydrolase [Alphaproteobacteria bacterium]